jgi:hypothetical protein
MCHTFAPELGEHVMMYNLNKGFSKRCVLFNKSNNHDLCFFQNPIFPLLFDQQLQL